MHTIQKVDQLSLLKNGIIIVVTNKGFYGLCSCFNSNLSRYKNFATGNGFMKATKRSNRHERSAKKRNRVRINYFRLCRALLLLVMFVSVISCIVVHSFVVCKEISLDTLHEKTKLIYMENIENTVNVEYSKSLYNINTKATNITNLHKPDKIIEVQCNSDDLNVNIVQLPKDDNLRIIGGY